MLWHKNYLDNRLRTITTGLIEILCNRIGEFPNSYWIYLDDRLIALLEKPENKIVD